MCKIKRDVVQFQLLASGLDMLPAVMTWRTTIYIVGEVIRRMI